MKTRKNSIYSALAVMVVALACNALTPKPVVSNIRMATDNTGKTTITSYTPTDAFYVFADLSGINPGSVIEAKWVAVNASGVDSNSEINTSDYTYESGIAFVYFQLTTNDGSDWPSGSYKVEIYLDGTKTGEQGFNVQ